MVLTLLRLFFTEHRSGASSEPRHPARTFGRIQVGGESCRQPFSELTFKLGVPIRFALATVGVGARAHQRRLVVDPRGGQTLARGQLEVARLRDPIIRQGVSARAWPPSWGGSSRREHGGNLVLSLDAFFLGFLKKTRWVLPIE
jgi:hypothetical protein